MPHSDASIIREQRSNRRGLMMGMTLAEVLILVLFALLLLLVRQSMQTQALEDLKDQIESTELDIATVHDYKEVILQLDEKGEDIDLLVELIEEIYSEDQGSITDAFNELVLAQERAKRLEQEVEGLKAWKEDLTTKLETIVGGQNLDELIQAMEEMQNEISRSRKENKDLISAINDITKEAGSDYPNCWYDASGKGQYLWSVGMYDEGLVVLDRYQEERAAAKVEMNLDKLPYGTLLTKQAFGKWSEFVFEWSRQQEPECRFFVVAYDLTGTNKAVYKTLLHGSVELYFYKSLARRPSESAFQASGSKTLKRVNHEGNDPKL